MPQAKKRTNKKRQDIDMRTKAPNDQLILLMINEYKGFHYLIQQIGKFKKDARMLQYLIFDPDAKQFFQHFNVVTPDPKVGYISLEDISRATVVMKDMAETTIDTILIQKDPENMTDEQKLAIEQGEVIIGAMEAAERGEAKTLAELQEEMGDEE